MTPITNVARVFPPCCFFSEASFSPKVVQAFPREPYRPPSTLPWKQSFHSSLLFTLVRGLRQKAACRRRRWEGGGEREGESARLKPDHSGLEWFSPAALGRSCSTALQYHVGAVEGGRLLTLRSFSGEGPRPVVPRPKSMWTCLPQGQSLASRASAGDATPG